MSGLKESFTSYIVLAVALTLSAGLGTVAAVEDQFSVDIGVGGNVVGGQGTGYDGGAWYYYPNTDWWNQWFYNGPYDANGKKTVEVSLTIRVLDPKAGSRAYVQVALNWTDGEWPSDTGNPPLPRDLQSPADEERLIKRHLIVPQTNIDESISFGVTYEITDYCPEWVSIDVRGENVSVEGYIQHVCESKDDLPIPTEDREFGDAPEGALAYPSSGIQGLFPTCVGVGPAAWIEHNTQWLYFGPKVDPEPDGNAGQCPAFNPNTYDQDEGMADGDAGLLAPRAYTIKGPAGSEAVYPLIFAGLQSIGSTCFTSSWGINIDIEVHNNRPDGRQGYVNLLMDWNHDGKWDGTILCPDGPVAEHALVNFPVPAGYNGPLSGLTPPNLKIGPLAGYVWARFSITERPIKEGWNGDGIFADGETEDYLLLAFQAPTVCDWERDDPHKMHWAQVPDLRATGLDVDLLSSRLTDDFQCAQSGPITDVHFWASFLDDAIPAKGPDSLRFEVNIYSNQPADNLITWSRPGELLWTGQVAPFTYDVRQVTNNIPEGWFDPARKFFEPENHVRSYQYNICFDPDDDLFVQKLGTIYWLEIREVPPQNPTYVFGWKATESHLQWNDNAVTLHPTFGWLPMTYPEGHPDEGKALDLAFVITGPPPEDIDFGDAPDPTYATVLVANGARHTIVPGIYLGQGVDGERDGQPNATATGDDTDGNDDEDGIALVSPFMPGGKVTLDVTASTDGYLNIWIDWNADGDWDDAGEQAAIDTALGAGHNPVTVDVPVTAIPGNTYARFRFSRMRGLSYDGPAPDGEVEDYRIQIVDIVIPDKPPMDHLKWSQPPIEIDPGSREPIFCGWDEPAYVSKPLEFVTPSWHMVADDFRCAGDMPVTSVHWWGSYTAWDGDTAPRIVPQSWRIAFWTNVPADERYRFSRPGQLVWLLNIPANEVDVERAGSDVFPQKPSDTCFQYAVQLEPHQYFWQDNFADAATDEQVFWISITAVYTGYPEPDYPWGWKTRPKPWMDGAVTFQSRRLNLAAGIVGDAGTMQPLTSTLVCERLDMYDMAFELDTDPGFIKWEQAFTGLRHWRHYEDEESLAIEGSGAAAKWLQDPDISSTGIDVDITKDLPPTWAAQICGDDFECTATGPITGITLWGSWYHDILPSGSAENITFTLSIREDIPASQSQTGYSKPGRVLWRKEFGRGQFTVEPHEGPAESYYSPANDTLELENHLMVYEYHFQIDPKEAFQQTGTASRPAVYWLCAQAQLVHAPGSVATRFGWKTSVEHWNDDAVWAKGEEPYQGSWDELRYPKGHPLAPRSIDLAFAIETEQPDTGLTFRRIVADDWKCTTPTPVTGLVWWGSYIGYGYQACDCPQMLPPQQPDHFLLSIWTDSSVASSAASRPGEKIWEYRTESFDEVLVGFDKHPEAGETDLLGFEPVYRYTVRLPQKDWFTQKQASDVYWLSVVAVYKNTQSMTYPWGWTNHPGTSNNLPGLNALAHWKLDEAAGITAADSSGNGNTASVRGNPLWRPASGQLGGALDLDGRDDYLKVEKPKGFDFAPDSFSVSMWVKPTEVGGRWQALMEYDRNGINSNRFGLWLNIEGQFHFRVGWSTWHSQHSLSPNEWTQLTATYDATTHRMDLYLDGVLDGTAYQSKGFSAPTQATLTIGVRGWEDDEFYYGLLDDIVVFGYPLSLEDILALRGTGSGGNAMAGQLSPISSTPTWDWTELYDQTGVREDMSFMLFSHPEEPLEDSGKAPGPFVLTKPEPKL